MKIGGSLDDRGGPRASGKRGGLLTGLPATHWLVYRSWVVDGIGLRGALTRRAGRGGAAARAGHRGEHIGERARRAGRQPSSYLSEPFEGRSLHGADEERRAGGESRQSVRALGRHGCACRRARLEPCVAVGNVPASRGRVSNWSTPSANPTSSVLAHMIVPSHPDRTHLAAAWCWQGNLGEMSTKHTAAVVEEQPSSSPAPYHQGFRGRRALN